MHVENNSLLSLLFSSTLDAMPKDPAYYICLTSSENIFKESFRSPPFASFSKDQMQLLSCFKFKFAVSSAFDFRGDISLQLLLQIVNAI